MRFGMAALAAASLAACVSASEVVPAGKDSFMVSGSAGGRTCTKSRTL